MKKTLITTGLMALWASIMAAGSLAAETPAQPGPQAGQKLAFMGDSITQFGGDRPTGYLHLVESAMKQQGRPIEVIQAGISGHTSKDMLARVDRDVIEKKPDWMTLSCGVNDVWHGANGVPLDQYKTNITAIVDKATAAGIKVVILTSTMIGEDEPNANNQKLIAYNDFLRALAKERNLPLADLNAEMQTTLAKEREQSHPIGNILTVDGVHMNGLGNQMMATGILKSFGFTEAQLTQARDMWMSLPQAMQLRSETWLSAQQYLQLRDLATKQGISTDELVNKTFVQDLQTLTSQPNSEKKP